MRLLFIFSCVPTIYLWITIHYGLFNKYTASLTNTNLVTGRCASGILTSVALMLRVISNMTGRAKGCEYLLLFFSVINLSLSCCLSVLESSNSFLNTSYWTGLSALAFRSDYMRPVTESSTYFKHTMVALGRHDWGW